MWTENLGKTSGLSLFTVLLLLSLRSFGSDDDDERVIGIWECNSSIKQRRNSGASFFHQIKSNFFLSDLLFTCWVYQRNDGLIEQISTVIELGLMISLKMIFDIFIEIKKMRTNCLDWLDDLFHNNWIYFEYTLTNLPLDLLCVEISCKRLEDLFKTNGIQSNK